MTDWNDISDNGYEDLTKPHEENVNKPGSYKDAPLVDTFLRQPDPELQFEDESDSEDDEPLRKLKKLLQQKSTNHAKNSSWRTCVLLFLQTSTLPNLEKHFTKGKIKNLN